MMLDGELDRGCCDEAHMITWHPTELRPAVAAREHGAEVGIAPHNDRRRPPDAGRPIPSLATCQTRAHRATTSGVRSVPTRPELRHTHH